MKRMGPNFERAMNTASAVLWGCLFGLLLTGVLVACKEAICPAIDLASKACPAIVKYVDEQGQPRTMQLSNEDVREMAATRAARRDAGAP